jgi:hypothetical protein
MQYATGDIWEFWERGFYAVIPTNCGWSKSGSAVMGAGLAKDAVRKFPGLAADYGRILQNQARNNEVARLAIYPEQRLIMFPVKKLDVAQPGLSWRLDASLTLIEQSCNRLRQFADGNGWADDFDGLGSTDIKYKGLPDGPIALPLIGCGNGKLKAANVIPIIEHHFADCDRIVFVRTK